MKRFAPPGWPNRTNNGYTTGAHDRMAYDYNFGNRLIKVIQLEKPLIVVARRSRSAYTGRLLS